ncbi:MAG: hypothetical protein ABIP94_12895 [Planctomycetota bacterium]
MLRLLFAMTFLFALGPVMPQAPLAPEATDARQIHWQRCLADALHLAAATGRPLLLAVNMDGESASDRIVHEEYRDPAFVALTRHCVCLGASVFRHNPRNYDDEGRRIPCPRFGGCTCGEHMALEPVLFHKYLADGERVAPRHVLVRTDGTKAFDLSLCFDLKDIDRVLAAEVEPGRGADHSVTHAPASLTEAAGMPGDWVGLARRRDHSGRAALEATLFDTHDEPSVLAALAAIGSGGDSGSLDALRLLAARVQCLPAAQCAALRAAAEQLSIAPELLAVLQDLAQAMGSVPGDAGPDARQRTLLQCMAAMAPTGTVQSFVRAGAAVGSWSSDGAGTSFPNPGDLDEPVRRSGGPVQLAILLQVANAVTRRDTTLPRAGGPDDTMPSAEALVQQLEALDAKRPQHTDDAKWFASYAKASLDLGRRHLESGARDTQLLFEDAARYFEKALDKSPAHCEWWIERARTAYFLQRFEQQVDCGRRAFALAAGADQMPLASELLANPVLENANAIEALRWIGDGNARLLVDRAGKAGEVAGMVEGLRALGIVAASPFGSDGDWISFASFCGALGLRREEQAIVQCGALRLSGSRDLRQALNSALWNDGRPDLSGVVAEAIERAHAPSAESAWFAGYAWILVAENARRCEQPQSAFHAYDAALRWFDLARTRNEGYRDSCSYFAAVVQLGKGLASVRAGDRVSAAARLAAAVVAHRDLSSCRDGLGYDVLDLVDKILEWRADTPSLSEAALVRPLVLLDQLDAVAPDDAFWAVAVADSALREALRADGRNPERAVRETVDAAGNKITMPMGLPTTEGDAWLQASIVAGRRALSRAKTDSDKQLLAQSLTIQAERQLERGKVDVQNVLAEAAPLLGLDAPTASADEAALRAVAVKLRTLLGEARPRQRDGR